ncbi:MAG: RNA polymerase sigma factor [Gammaproteobacteria bacterium]
MRKQSTQPKIEIVVSGREPEADPVDDRSVRLWVRAAQSGDIDALEKLYRRFAGLVYGLCLRMLASPADAEDCVQLTFTKAWSQLERFEGRSKFETWLHRIAVNEALMEDRRRSRRFELIDACDETSANPGGMATTLDIEEAISTLPMRRRQVFVLKAVYGYSHEEIADLLGVSSGTARAQYHQARQTLMGVLRQEIQDV